MKKLLLMSALSLGFLLPATVAHAHDSHHKKPAKFERGYNHGYKHGHGASHKRQYKYKHKYNHYKAKYYGPVCHDRRHANYGHYHKHKPVHNAGYVFGILIK